jgi:sulfur transfer complex TusBCD TusB component (DsrH family)
VDTIVLISRAHAETAFKLAQKMYMDGSAIHILFMGRGTHHISRDDIMKKLYFAKLYTFETEFNSPKDEVRAISYEEFVKLLEKCERTFTWI